MERPLAEGNEDPEELNLVDAKNGFNKLSRYSMMCILRHLWLKGARFAFNCYEHSVQLIIQTSVGKARKILSS